MEVLTMPMSSRGGKIVAPHPPPNWVDAREMQFTGFEGSKRNPLLPHDLTMFLDGCGVPVANGDVLYIALPTETLTVNPGDWIVKDHGTLRVEDEEMRKVLAMTREEIRQVLRDEGINVDEANRRMQERMAAFRASVAEGKTDDPYTS